jgi:lysozyme
MVYHGIVEDTSDPLKCARVRVRIFGLHTDDKNLIPIEDLPWAQTIKSTDSASISGIGTSSTQLVRGSWVIVDFLDEDKQYPIVMGTLHGIPKDPYSEKATDEELIPPDVSNAVWKDGSGNPITTEDAPVTSSTPEEELKAPTDGARRASDFTSVSDKCISLIKQSEGLSLKAYPDPATGGDPWTIGYGTTVYPDGRPVKPGDSISKAQAEEYLKSDVNKKFLPGVHRSVKVPVTQEMVDALVSFSYNVGSSAMGSSTLVKDLNAEKYELAASRFLDWTKANGKELPGLVTRRGNEKSLFLSGGVPTVTGGLKKDPATEASSSSGSSDSSGSSSTTTQPKKTTNQILGERGFTDPTGKYPLYRDEPDTHRLARHEKIQETIVYKKEVARDMKVPIAGSGTTWDQSPIPYNAEYPYNRVYSGESGHIMEFDDTPDSRRIHLYHAAGTYLEIDDNGTQVNRIIGDGYEILERNGFVHIKGGLNVTVDGVHNLKVQNAVNIDIDGATNINVFNDVNLKVSGNLNTSVKGDMMTTVGGKYHIRVAGPFAVDASRIDLNSGAAGTLASPLDKKAPEPQQFSSLNVKTRGTESSMQYEMPEEGSATTYNNQRLSKGEVTKEELEAPVEKKQTEKVPPKDMSGVFKSDCSDLSNMTEFPPSFSLSKNFTIGSFNKNGSRPIIAQMGLKPDEIACNLKQLAMNVLDPIKAMYPHMVITSGFRRPGDAPNSAKTSAHYSGQAVDIQLPGFSKDEYLAAAKKISAAVPYDQLLLEYSGTNTTWIHVSFKKSGNRGELFTMHNHKKISGSGELVLV